MAELHSVDQQLAATNVLLGNAESQAPSAPESFSPPRLPQRRNSLAASWREYILEHLASSTGGKTLKEMLEATAGTPFAEKHALSPNSFYASLSKLERAGKVIRKGKVAYLRETLARIEAGEVEEDPPRDHDAEGAGMALFVKRALERYGDGLKAGEVLKALRSDPDAAERVERNPQVVYGTLGRMAQAKTIERDWRGYYRLTEPAADAASEDAASKNITPFPGAGHG
jgi:hypothetical protein